MHRLATTTTVCCVLVAAVCQAQEASDHHEQLKFLDTFVGSWKLEGKWDDGVEFVGEETSAWIFQGKFLRSSGWGKNRDGQRVNYRIVSGWDPAAKQVYSQFTWSDGGHSRRVGAYDAATKLWTARETGTNADGSTFAFDVSLNLTNPDRVAWSATNRKQSSGEPVPELRFDLVRQPPGPGLLPTRIRKQLARSVGSWEFQTVVGGKTLKSTLVSRWAPGKHCVRWTYAGPARADSDKSIHASGTMGWDQQRGKIKEVGFDSLGGSFTTFWTIRRNRWSGYRTGVMDGQSFRSQVTIQWKKDDLDSYSSRETKRVVGGKPRDDLAITVQRKPQS